jgi:16S rRNA (adenine1518-N6/adenine1519-N6)-dimethyltransferase
MKRKGQHYLVDQSILGRIADYAELMPSDRVLEIGPGTGNLTEVLSSRADTVFAVEVDPALYDALDGRFENVKVIRGDALKVELPDYSKVVSNLPYQISSKVTLRLLPRKFDLMVLMYQKEFAHKLAARPGTEEYGRISMATQAYADVEILEVISKMAFRPVPQVDSALVRLRPRATKIVTDDLAFMELTVNLFNHRRKKVGRALAYSGVSGDVISGLDESILSKRPEEITPEECAHLASEISSRARL